VLDEALEVVRHRPHSMMIETEEHVDPGGGLKPSRQLARQVAGAGERTPVPALGSGLAHLPRDVVRVVHEESFDTVPNRFVRFAVEQWRDLAEDVTRLLGGNQPARTRGRGEAAWVSGRLESALSIPALRDAGALTQFPTSNTVLSSRVGYRDIFRAYLLADTATSIDFAGREDVFSAGQRDVAALYEYWAFVELARIVQELGFDVNRRSLVRVVDSRLSLELRRGKASVLSAHGTRRGRRVHLELWFNRSFTSESWTVTMRPDCSLLIRPDDPQQVGEEFWLHFDAKYRIDQYTSLFVDDEQVDGDSVRVGGAKGDDLRKMHAYRDGIRGTGGAFVLYPGGDDDSRATHREYHEVLPGLGAFVLRPTAGGEASGAGARALKAFLNEVLDHAAAQGTRRERTGYWKRRALEHGPGTSAAFDFDPELNKPPADVSALLGFVKSTDHLDWVQQNRLYNLRGDPSRRGSVRVNSPQLRADLVVLYGAHTDEVVVYRATGALFLRSAHELRTSGYPDPQGSNYLCLELDNRLDHSLVADRVRDLTDGRAEPVVRTWQQILAQCGVAE
jgi:hypothetical protein